MKTVFVSGGTCRVGKAIAETLMADGWNVITSSHRADSGADIICDFTKDGAAGYLCGELELILRGAYLNAVVNNASLFTGEDKDVYRVGFEMPKKRVEHVCSVQKELSVVNILDADIIDSSRKAHNSYEKSKLDLAKYTLCSKNESLCRLRMNGVALGPVLPPVGVHVKASATPLGRPTLQSVAEAVMFLLGAKYTSNCIIPVSGAPVNFGN
jgi:NAD(P)-dependent dehydrogenase (short-subunit alcohol dehydrogenase family)